jgi:hypothetical protein
MLFARQYGRCGICGHRFPEPLELPPERCAPFVATFDHLIAPSNGGGDALENLQLVHKLCGVRRWRPSAYGPLQVPNVLKRPRDRELHADWYDAAPRCFHRHGRAKIAYDSITQAWHGALKLFADTGAIAVPYRCTRKLVVYQAVDWRPSSNPWSFRAYDARLHPRRRAILGCGNWHLTTKHGFMLPGEQGNRCERARPGCIEGPVPSRLNP